MNAENLSPDWPELQAAPPASSGPTSTHHLQATAADSPPSPPRSGRGLGEVSPPSPAQLATASAQPASPFPQARGESDRAFEAFRAYLELGSERRYAAAARKVGASLRTVERWASDFDWRGRVKACAAQGAAQYLETQAAVQRADCLDAAARAKAFRDRQYDVAEGILAIAERYFERLDDADPDQISFADACKAVEVASRLKQQAQVRETDDANAPTRGQHDQFAALLDQTFTDTPSPNGAGNQPHSTPPPSAQA